MKLSIVWAWSYNKLEGCSSNCNSRELSEFSQLAVFILCWAWCSLTSRWSSWHKLEKPGWWVWMTNIFFSQSVRIFAFPIYFGNFLTEFQFSFSSGNIRNGGFHLWMLRRLNFKRTGFDKIRGKESGTSLREKRNSAQAFVWGNWQYRRRCRWNRREEEDDAGGRIWPGGVDK